MCIQVCGGVHGDAKASAGVWECGVRVYTLEYSAWAGKCGCERVCTDVSRCASECAGVRRCIRVCTGQRGVG